MSGYDGGQGTSWNLQFVIRRASPSALSLVSGKLTVLCFFYNLNFIFNMILMDRGTK